MIPPAGEDTNEPSLVVRNRELAERPDASPDDDDDVAGPDVGDLASHEPAARVDEHVEPIDRRRPRRSSSRARCRRRSPPMTRSPLMDAKAFARAFEDEMCKLP